MSDDLKAVAREAARRAGVPVETKTDLPRLGFLRWLGEQGRLEHDVAGEPSGPLVKLRDAAAEGRAG